MDGGSAAHRFRLFTHDVYLTSRFIFVACGEPRFQIGRSSHIATCMIPGKSRDEKSSRRGVIIKIIGLVPLFN